MTTTTDGVRVRFAPSPTGDLHVGGLRTALFNYLFARKHGGRFVLRIEDTDRERFVAGTEQGIVDMLRWAGLTPDEGPGLGGDFGPYRQSERLERYAEAAERLIADGHAYRCTCTPEEVERMRTDQQARGLPIRYDGRCRDLSDDERRSRAAEGRTSVVRMRIPQPDERVVVDDLVRGKVVFGSEQLDDQVLIKSDGFPTYHLAVVVDDHAMGITHVLRAEEWLPSTPKHLYLYRWLGYPPPVYAHLPLLLNPDRSKMSKRSGDTAAEDYRSKGYLPDALVNFLALLGWNPGDDREEFSLSQLEHEFSVERVAKSGAVFDRAKLDWMNQLYLGKMEPGALYDALRPYIAETPYAGGDEAILRRICTIVQPRLVRLSDIAAHLPLFCKADDAPLAAEAAAMVDNDDARRVFVALHGQLAQAESEGVPPEVFKAAVKAVQKETGVKGKGLWGAIRAALTLATEGPDLAAVVEVLGKERVLARLKRVMGR